jgi:cytochrome c-type biogenesis protein CcmF
MFAAGSRRRGESVLIVELGHYALILALVVAALQASLPLVGAARRDARLMAVADTTAPVQFLLVAFSFAALANAYVSSDFSVLNVAQNSHTAKPLLYKITGVWGNHEGSMLLWVLILTLFGAAVSVFGRNLPPSLRARVLAVQGMVGVGFFLFILLTSNPFLRLFPVPANGRGMNPILQDPGLAIHPPFLYLGYVGFSVSFAFAVAALIEGRVDAAWARWVRPWTLAAWCALTCGIALGSWWAYYELGWGGFWAWDPVENASFMPWLAGTALLHSAIVVEKRDALKSWTILLAIITFSLSLIGTFLVRSGVLTSVHAFAVDPARGAFILVLLGVTIGGALTLYAWRAPTLKAGGLFAPISREGALLLNNLLLAAGAATVFLGTLYPLFLDVLTGERVSVGPPFFNATFVPLMVPLLIALGIGPLLTWKRADLWGVVSRLKFTLAFTIGVVLLIVALDEPDTAKTAFGMGLAAWLAGTALAEWAGRVRLFRGGPGETWRLVRNLPRSTHGMTIAHFGVAVVVVGLTGSLWRQERIEIAHPGETLTIAGYAFHLDRVARIEGPNYTADRAVFTVTRNGKRVAVMQPEKRFYAVQQSAVSNTAIRTDGLADLYAAMGDPDGKGGWTVRLYFNPLVPWIWFGALIMALGGLASLSDRRFRIGVARRPAEADAGRRAGARA